MILSQLISELQKLQALHGDLPVTREDEEGERQTIRNLSASDSWFFNWSKVKREKGPHIHLS